MNKDRFLSVCMDPEIKRRLKEAAAGEKRTLSSFCQLILENHLPTLPEIWVAPSQGRKGKECIGFRVGKDLLSAVDAESSKRSRSLTAICEMTFGYWTSQQLDKRKQD